ncbi:MFS transporter [Thermococcus siculi]|uniref:MFS transporter n=1 Tax=Thermococcus siculi TaxID=72803 RepID=A0A2Z2MYQ3_9EURY|nr:MFS transporter [Thermococcus siculi]ASJ09150.1 MFS transporter [Thermococcus siculi]
MLNDLRALGRNYWLYTVGRWISQAGWVVQDVAVPLYVLDKTGSGAMMSLFVMAELIPRLVLNPIAGVIGDRYDRKKLMYGLDLARGALLFAVIGFNLLDLRSLLVVQIAMSVMGTFFSAGISGMFPDLVEKEQLARANSVLQMGGQILRIAGPVLGGLIYALGGISLAILINAASFLGSGLFEVLIEYEWETRGLSSVREVWKDMLEGFRFIKGSRAVTLIISYAIILNTLLNPIFVVLIPYMARVVMGFSAVQFGGIEAAFTVGALAGNLLIAGKLGERSEGLVFKAIFAQLILMLSLAFVPGLGSLAYPIFLGLLGAIGFSNVLVNVPLFTKLQKAVPGEVRSRVFAAFETAVMATTPIGMAVAGPLLDVIGIVPLIVGAVLPSIAVTLYYLRFKETILNIGFEKTPGEVGA